MAYTYSPELLRLNVGFIIHETVGYTRDFPIDIPAIQLPPDLELNNLRGNVRVTRTAQGLLVQAKMQAEVPAECVRCLTDFQQTLDAEFTDLYAFSRAAMTEAEMLLPENGKIDLAPVVREEMLLAMPIGPVCSPDCKGLCPICGENLNEDPAHRHEEEEMVGGEEA
jgi:uncharacterized protein